MSAPCPGSRCSKGPRSHSSSGPGLAVFWMPVVPAAPVVAPTRGGCRLNVFHAGMAILASSAIGRHPRTMERTVGISKMAHTTA
jgi:hypothetical protein